MRRNIIACIIAMMMATAVWAKEAEPTIQDPVIRQRMAHLTSELRCLVCQGESLADSSADFAQDMRNKILELMQQGKSDQEIRDFLVQRYGDFILFRPPLKSTTVWLWFGPPALLLVGGAVLYFNLARRRRRVNNPPLSAAEEARVKALLTEESGETKA